ncbi:mechanosensitive ion channel protein 3, chloroplastic [Capsicum chacoense]|uniref:Mechanosensitive ion channel protein 3, chloroplastic n=1 Tax=Capsicum annuum TaxID=4072 RepID=A0A1U8GLT9_CAPAN|nr:mechanosensitive ion channel protein 3, chloroplastic [Capsicum annuum]XP_016569054.1 mechanosensitive ion channel protein 3, chloroplastic [Capsicum annuum]PHT84356.1 Mechanosensitive ion channel protein 3, chloroplastic [Capsicum annuum]
MAAAVSLLLPREFPIHGKCRLSGQSKGTLSRSQTDSCSTFLSSHSARQDPWSIYLLNTVCRPLFSHPSQTRCNVLPCHSLLKPGGGYESQVLETAAKIWKRSLSTIHGSPLVLQLVPAIGVLVFAAWGLTPLMRFGRMLFLRESDSNWKQSSWYYVTASYLKPVLFWTGAILICRAIDPMILPTVASQAVKQRFLNFIRSLSTVMALAYCLSSLIQQTQKFLVETKDPADARNMGFEFAGKAVYTAVWVAAVSLFMELLGFSTQRWLTAGGLGTVLLTLAGREILTNFLSSIMIHATRPFILNDWIQTKIQGYDVSGTVEHVGWWSPTVIRGDDREAIHIPNHKFSVNIVRNLTQKTHWRIKTHLAISHLDVNKINNIVADMRKVLSKHPLVEQQRLHRRVFLDNIDPENQALKILISCFVKTSHFEEYLRVKEVILLDLLRVISHHRARLATPIRTVQKTYREPDVDDVPFAGSVYSRNRPNSEVLLIEPSYKISSVDKAKEKDQKVEAPSTSQAADDTNSLPSTLSEKEVVKVSSASNANGELKAATSSSDGKMLKQGSANPVKSNSEKKQVASAAVDPPGLTSDSAIEKTDVASSASQPQEDAERSISPPSVGRPMLEDNIVLGVALEGSKLTLPIDEETPPSSPSPTFSDSESKELAACRNGSSSTNSNKDKTDDKLAGPPTAQSASNDQKERER